MVEKALKGVERVLIVHGTVDLDLFPLYAQVVVDAAKNNPSVKVLGKVI